jgi:hypothetical protein
MHRKSGGFAGPLPIPPAAGAACTQHGGVRCGEVRPILRQTHGICRPLKTKSLSAQPGLSPTTVNYGPFRYNIEANGLTRIPIDQPVLIDIGSASIPPLGGHRLHELAADVSRAAEFLVNFLLIFG